MFPSALQVSVLLSANRHCRSVYKPFRCTPLIPLPQVLLPGHNTTRQHSFAFRGIAKAGEPNNFLPMSSAALPMEPSFYGTLRRKQRRLARENPGVLLAVARAANQAISECQYQFRNRRWNCSTKNFLRGKNLFGKIVDKGKSAVDRLNSRMQVDISRAIMQLCLSTIRVLLPV